MWNFRMPVAVRLQDTGAQWSTINFNAEQAIQLFIACEDPQASGRPISQWTARELAQEMKKTGIVESISVRHVGRLR